MGNVLCVLKRDIVRLLKAPAALVVAIALLVLPSLYTWYNVVAFWNPYEATGNLSVGVVNEDAGAETDMTGPLNVGERVEEALAENDALNWVRQDYETAIEDLKLGKLYAVYVIPEDFTECLVSPLTGEVKAPKLQYYANEKLTPVSPKITDIAASTLDQTINSMFVSAVSEAAVNVVEGALEDAGEDLAETKSKAAAHVYEAKAAIEEAHDVLEDIQNAAENGRQKVVAANAAMDDAASLGQNARNVLQDVTDEADAVQSSLSKVSTGAVSGLSGVLANVSETTAKASTVADGFAASAGAAQTEVDMAASRIQPLIDNMSRIAGDLQKVADALPSSMAAAAMLRDEASDMSARSSRLQGLSDKAVTLSERIANASREAANATEALNGAAQATTDSLQDYSDDLFGSVAPTVNTGLAEVGEACARVSASISSLDATVKQAQESLGALDGLLADCATAMGKTDELVTGLQDDFDSVVADVRLLAQSDEITGLLKNGTLNSQNISEFMGSPTTLNTEEFYPFNAYGSAMAPLFMNLTFWIGAFMLVVVFKVEVDDEGVKGLTPGQRYASRLMFFALFAVVQALICCAGTLALGVQAANAPALFLGAVVSSLAFLSVIYMLSSLFKHVGKGLCIVLVFAQIPGGSGLYPVEMTDGFFQALYPYLPFTYGIDVMREAIFGLYGTAYATDLVLLAGFIVGSLVVGLVATPAVSNVVHMAAKQVREGDLYNGEDALAPERPFRLAQVLRALTERDDFRDSLRVRREKFERRYPVFIRAAIVLGVGVPVVIGLLVALDAAEKVVLLTMLLVWLLLLAAFLVVVESLRYSYERQAGLEHLSDESLLSLFGRRNHFTSADEAVAALENAKAKRHANRAKAGARVKERLHARATGKGERAEAMEPEAEEPLAEETAATEAETAEGAQAAGVEEPGAEEPEAEEPEAGDFGATDGKSETAADEAGPTEHAEAAEETEETEATKPVEAEEEAHNA